jgi:hypothetical protein
MNNTDETNWEWSVHVIRMVHPTIDLSDRRLVGSEAISSRHGFTILNKQATSVCDVIPAIDAGFGASYPLLNGVFES